MTDPRSPRLVEELFAKAADLEGERLAAFLDSACAGDEGLRREVESLLAADRGAGAFMEEGAMEVAARGGVAGTGGSWVGKTFGNYEVLELLGVGGMGDVYKGRDTRLDRYVAIKFLGGHIIDNPEARQRFEREARTVAALNHPHICVLHDVGRQDGVDYLVMEFLDGDTLSARLNRGPLPLDEALQVAIQISDALGKIHTLGITHRDLKPGNIMLTESGAKLMDFGLAKRQPPVKGGSASMALIGVADLTKQGVIIGTVQYMAPEQVEGEEADARTDIFTLGALLYEMVTGQKAFSGKTAASRMASILQTQPIPMSALQSSAPPALQRVVEICMSKSPRDRWQNAHDVTLQLKSIAEGGSMVGLAEPASHRRKHREWLAWSVAALALTAVGALAIPYLWKKAPEDVRAVRFWIPPKNGTAFGPENSGMRPFPAISPNGAQIVFQAQEPNEPTLLWVRSLDSFETAPLPGTEMAGPAIPFWSPDSRYIGFTANGKMKKVEATGGPVQVICDVVGSAEATWNRDGVILFANGLGTGAGPNEGLLRVSEAGGNPVSVTTPNKERKETTHRAPYFLPDGRHFLFLAQPPNVIYAGSLDSTEPPVRLFASDSRAVYASPGYVLFVQQGKLMGQRFDPTALKLSGDPFLIAENARANIGNGRAAFGVSDGGTLVYRTGNSYSGEGLRVIWLDRNGKPIDTINQVQDNRFPRLSPDEKHLVVERRSTLGCTNCSDLWVIDLLRGTNTRVTLGKGDANLGAWSPDGTRILYRANPGGTYALYTKLMTGEATEDLLLKFDQEITGAADWSQDGRYVLFTASDPGTGSDIWFLPLFGDRQPQAFVKTPFNDASPRFSFDGKWMAYTSSESGTDQVYVQPFPSGGPRVQISVDGGTNPRWRRDGKELFFLASSGALMAVDLKGTSSKIEPGVPKRLFQPPTGFNNNFAVTSDGNRFLFAVPQNTMNNLTTVDDAPLTVILNWTASLKK